MYALTAWQNKQDLEDLVGVKKNRIGPNTQDIIFTQNNLQNVIE